MINMPLDQVEALAGAIVDARKNVKYCKVCCTLTDQEVCPICSNSERDHKTIMVVETPRDLAAYEKTGKYNGVIMCCTEQSRPCLESDRGISV